MIVDIVDKYCTDDNNPIKKTYAKKKKRNFHFSQANEGQAILEVPGRAGLVGRSADAVARGLGRAQASARQPLSGLRPLGLPLEVSFFFLL